MFINNSFMADKVVRLLNASESLPKDSDKVDGFLFQWRLAETQTYFKKFGGEMDEPAKNLRHLFKTIGSESDALRAEKLKKCLSESTGIGSRVIDAKVKEAKAKTLAKWVSQQVGSIKPGMAWRAADGDPVVYEGLTNYAEALDSKGKVKRAALKLKNILDGLLGNVKDVVFNVGGTLQRISGLSVNPLKDAAALFSLTHDIYGENNDWVETPDAVTKQELYNALERILTRYESVRLFPTLIKRPDTLYLAKEEDLPPPTGAAFERLTGFFSPATNEDKILLTTAFALPFWGYWETPQTIVDPVSGRGAGKSTLVYSIANLLGQIVMTVPESDWRDTERLRRRLVAGEGRMRIIVVADNVEGVYSSAGMAEIITSPFVSAMPNHGIQEVARPKDFCVFATMNDAIADTDQASRSVVIMVKHAEVVSHTWEIELNAFIEENRRQIWSDILDYLRCATPFRYSKGRGTRFARYESEVLSAFCASQSVFDSVMDVILERQMGTDTELDKVDEFVLGIDNYVIAKIIAESNMARRLYPDTTIVGLDNSTLRFVYFISTGEKGVVQKVTKFLRRIVEQGAAPRLHFSENGKINARHRGVFWVGSQVDTSKPDWMKAHLVFSEMDASKRMSTSVEYPETEA